VKISEATFTIVDVESTGVDPAVDRVCEVAMLRVEDVASRGVGAPFFASLVNPEMPMPATASAVHHLVDEDVVGAPKLLEIAADIVEFAGDSICVAHTSSFDSSFLPMLANSRWLCSCRLAHHLIPEAPAFKNNVLRYYLGARIDVGDAHRALADCRVTAYVLKELIAEYVAQGRPDDVDALLHFARSLFDYQRMPFGLHRGKAFSEIPEPYLQWILRGIKDDADLRATAAHELARRRSAAA